MGCFQFGRASSGGIFDLLAMMARVVYRCRPPPRLKYCQCNAQEGAIGYNALRFEVKRKARMQWVELLLVCLLAVDSLAQSSGSLSEHSLPPTRRDSTQEVLHGVTVIDPFRWLED